MSQIAQMQLYYLTAVRWKEEDLDDICFQLLQHCPYEFTVHVEYCCEK